MKLLLIALIELCILAGPLAAQTAENLNFLSGLPEFENRKAMLPSYLKAKAAELLAARQRKISQFSKTQDIVERRAYVRERMLQALGKFPERTPLNARVVGVLERNDYKVEKIIFESQPRFYVTANLYLPKQGSPPYPGILFPLGHEAGAKANPVWQQMLGALAQKGFVALAWDPVGQGERMQLYDPDFKDTKVFRSTTEHSLVGVQCLLAGDNLARYTVWDGMRALDYLLSRKEVDATRIGCTGNSGGGTHTAYLSALDDRIHVAAPSCYLTSWGQLLETIGPQDAEQNLPPWLGQGLDHADFVHAFAPKPYLILSAIRDFFSIAGARQTFREAKGVYALLGAKEKLDMVEADDGHGYTKPRRLAAYRWFSRWLKGVDDQGAEPVVELAAEEELRCTDSGQVVTSLVSETVFSLNKQRVEQLARNKGSQLQGAQPAAAHQEEIRRQVRRLSGFEPHKSPLEVKPYGHIARPGYRIEKLVYESEPGIVIPALFFLPDKGQERKAALLYVDGRGKATEARTGGEIESFVERGFAVLAPDIRGTGETYGAVESGGSDFPRYFGDFDSAMTALLLGKTLVGMRANDISRAVDLLAVRPEVDREKIYGLGKSGGAVPLLYAAALDDRIKKVALDGMLVAYESIVTNRIHRQVFEHVVPSALKFYDFPDLVIAVAPRPVWLVDPVDALGFQVGMAEVKARYKSAAAAYQAARAADSIQIRQRRPGEGAGAVYRELFGSP